MSDRESRVRTALTTYFPMFIAVLSLSTAIFNGYLNTKFLDLFQRNLGRGEYMKTCKEVIDAYFQVKFRAGVIGANHGEAGAASRDEMEGANAVTKFAALGTYLANLRDDDIRERYTHLSLELEKIMTQARNTPTGDIGKLFENADQMFAEMNDDCVKSAKDALM